MGWPRLPKRDPQATQPPNGSAERGKSNLSKKAKTKPSSDMPDTVQGPANGPDVINVPKKGRGKK